MTESNKDKLRVIAIVALFIFAGCVDSLLLSWGV